jgi:hypothetical protein
MERGSSEEPHQRGLFSVFRGVSSTNKLPFCCRHILLNIPEKQTMVARRQIASASNFEFGMRLSLTSLQPGSTLERCLVGTLASRTLQSRNLTGSIRRTNSTFVKEMWPSSSPLIADLTRRSLAIHLLSMKPARGSQSSCCRHARKG